jgi:hypothetical protein
MAQSGPTVAVIPFQWIKSAERVEFDIRTHVRVTQDVIPRDIELLTTLALVTEKDNRWPLDLIVVFKVQF